MRAFAAAVLLAAMPLPAAALPACSADALNALHVPGLTVTRASHVAMAPAHCAVQGTIQTAGEDAPPGSARFALQLPDDWRQRFFSMGVGGNAGTLTPSVNATDRASALGKGYAVIVQDSGHEGNGTSAAWLKKRDGSRDAAKMVDFLYRAEHAVTVAGKRFVAAYYGAPVRRAYFDGCSTGGRMGMMEAERYPGDYDGIIAGDPAMDYHSTLLRLMIQKAALSSRDAWLSPDTVAMIDKVVNARCDAADGARDGLVQDPARCPVKPQDLICRGRSTTDCLTRDQALVLKAYTSPVRDRRRQILYPGFAITNLSGPRGAAYWNTGETAPDLSDAEHPWGDETKAPRGWIYAREAITWWLGMGPDQKLLSLPLNPKTGRVGDRLVAAVDRAFGPGETKNPLRLMSFIQQDRKLILYHGASDPAIPAARTVQFYQELSAALHGRAQANVRLFLVPGMQHCSGGVGPDQFDTLSALEAWVEQGKAPDAIAASTKPDAAEKHALPLCPYPRQARYRGTGDVTDAANWSCAG